ncbi:MULTISPECIES: hypothetical protein [unclassified Sphingobacterium]|uniref:hypothetical protein n=1 Tax=unclassified Sphingobacterium TaxID=2609468 RepID=UPI0025EDC43F|nr:MULTISPECIES: hypothetical protein [unclassified Sphingobacterium]
MEKYEIVKQVKWCVADVTIHGRILKNVISGISSNYPYSWEISKYCSINGDIDVYIPGQQIGISVADAEQNMENYINRFENYIIIKDNDTF